MKSRESSITKSIMRWLKAQGFRPLKWHGSKYGRAGVPDIHCCFRGHCLWLEVKRSDEEPTMLQHLVQKDLVDGGAMVFVVTSLKEVKELLS